MVGVVPVIGGKGQESKVQGYSRKVLTSLIY
jgi:hypothetical protein